ncbi:MAG: hypothetical protein V1854_05465 [Methanobacteriota archaeon]
MSKHKQEQASDAVCDEILGHLPASFRLLARFASGLECEKSGPAGAEQRNEHTKNE